MADDTADAHPTGTLWLVIGLVSGALLVTGAGVSPWISTAAFALSLFMYVRVQKPFAMSKPESMRHWPPRATRPPMISAAFGALLVRPAAQ
ncbi:hypothetical protein ABXZ31_02714 [Clavibacter nebraskensis]|nr:hypothetical protein VV38_13165 [Clavibacter nebraskensis]UKF28647.1 hypothetical protein FGQ65_10850 [Clavibacter nebraskensis]